MWFSYMAVVHQTATGPEDLVIRYAYDDGSRPQRRQWGGPSNTALNILNNAELCSTDGSHLAPLIEDVTLKSEDQLESGNCC